MGRALGRRAAFWVGQESHVYCHLPLPKPDSCSDGVAPSPPAWQGLCADKIASNQDPGSPFLCLDNHSLFNSDATETRLCARAGAGHRVLGS